MGTLHGVYQLKPKVIHGAAFLKVCQAAEPAFPTIYERAIAQISNGEPWPHNTLLQRPSPHLLKHGPNQNERSITGFVDGLYVFVQGGSKHGFEREFVQLMEVLAVHLEDALFCVVWDHFLQEFHIAESKLLYCKRTDYGHDWVAYCEAHYGDDQSLLPAVYLEEVGELKRSYEGLVEMGEEVDEWFDREDWLAAIAWLDKTEEIETADGELMALRNWVDARIAGTKTNTTE